MNNCGLTGVWSKYGILFLVFLFLPWCTQRHVSLVKRFHFSFWKSLCLLRWGMTLRKFGNGPTTEETRTRKFSCLCCYCQNPGGCHKAVVVTCINFSVVLLEDLLLLLLFFVYYLFLWCLALAILVVVFKFPTTMNYVFVSMFLWTRGICWL